MSDLSFRMGHGSYRNRNNPPVVLPPQKTMYVVIRAGDGRYLCVKDHDISWVDSFGEAQLFVSPLDRDTCLAIHNVTDKVIFDHYEN
jgi:hypothetical protein